MPECLVESSQAMPSTNESGQYWIALANKYLIISIYVILIL